MISQTPWAERKFEFSFPVGLFPIFVERLRGAPIRLQSILRNVGDEILNEKNGERWSVIEQVSHLCNSEEVWYGRVEDFLSGEEVFRVRPLKTDIASNNIMTLLQNFADARKKLVSKVENLDEGTASLTILHPRLQKRIRLIDSLFTTAEHDDHHLAKIRELLGPHL